MIVRGVARRSTACSAAAVSGSACFSRDRGHDHGRCRCHARVRASRRCRPGGRHAIRHADLGARRPLGEERAADLSVEDGKRRPVEVY